MAVAAELLSGICLAIWIGVLPTLPSYFYLIFLFYGRQERHFYIKFIFFSNLTAIIKVRLLLNTDNNLTVTTQINIFSRVIFKQYLLLQNQVIKYPLRHKIICLNIGVGTFNNRTLICSCSLGLKARPPNSTLNVETFVCAFIKLYVRLLLQFLVSP